MGAILSIGSSLVPRLAARTLAILSGSRVGRRTVIFYHDQTAALVGIIGLSWLAAGSVVAGPFIIRRFVDGSLVSRQSGILVSSMVLLLLVFVLEAAVVALRISLLSRLGETVLARVRGSLSEKIATLPFGFFPSARQSHGMTLITNDAMSVQSAATVNLPAVFAGGFNATVAIPTVLVLDWRLALVAAAFAPLPALMSLVGRSAIRRASSETLEIYGRMMGQIIDLTGVSGALHIRLFGRHDHEIARMRVTLDSIRTSSVARMTIVARQHFLVVAAAAVSIAATIGIGSSFVVNGSMTIGTLVAFASALAVAFQPMSTMAIARSQLVGAGPSIERVFTFLDLPVGSTPIRTTYTAATVAYNHPADERRTGPDVVVEKLWFRYAPAEDDGRPDSRSSTPITDDRPLFADWALRGVDLKAAPGSTVAIVGPSGAGKTTLTYLIAGLYRPNAGRILLDGTDITNSEADQIHTMVGLVAQEPHLFHDTIAANLRYGRAEATEDEMVEALTAVNLGLLLARLPEGLNTTVGARGYQLSGGERQRLAIARVLLQDPRLLILDEATSQLDTVSETHIREAMKTLAHGRTCIIVAHRLSTIVGAEKIFVLDGGCSAEEGNHDELLAEDGIYARLYRTQAGAPD
ncbi:ABC transporter ATP-binding protein [Frankia sp. Cppng1_Ct_nod]|uniref:ABC transporter ATP-binding protein n=1 Tax=Frankia sp. Cppng1_Ct_nod TaxID=2897162 RepID=UPI001041B75E|nr:ABC transporter ATP-binding protein [Frankia sp. Cppng1_Ct_nod]